MDARREGKIQKPKIFKTAFRLSASACNAPVHSTYRINSIFFEAVKEPAVMR